MVKPVSPNFTSDHVFSDDTTSAKVNRFNCKVEEENAEVTRPQEV